MHRQGHPRRFEGDHFIDELGIPMGQFIGVIASLASGFPHFVIAKVRKIRIVHLNVTATRIEQTL
jgi:hypothetical protein